MPQYGIFINYRREDRHLAGRIYDYLRSKGLDPFMDVYSLGQGDFEPDLLKMVEETPYFLCVLSGSSFNAVEETDIYYKEIDTAYAKKDRMVLIVADWDFNYDNRENLAPVFKRILKRNIYQIDQHMKNFYQEMERLCSQDIDLRKLAGVINWREYAAHQANVFLTSRAVLEKDRDVGSWNNRFGPEIVDYVEKTDRQTPYAGEYRIKHINMACYAASIIFAYDRDMVDHQAYDYGKMFNLFSVLLRDPDFSMTLITNNPDCPAAVDAVENDKLGNSSFDEFPRAVFLASFANIDRLVKEEPFKQAKKEKRFKHLLTNAILPFAYFQIIYKDKWAEFNHIKLDLYTEGLASNEDRRSVYIFEKDHPDTYAFLQSQFMHVQQKTRKYSKKLISDNRFRWITEWERFLEEREEEE